MKKLKKIIVLILVVFVFSIIIGNRMKVKNYTVQTSKVNNDINIVLITDLHSCYYGKDMKNLVEAVKNENPDVVLLGGDIYDEKTDNKNTKVFLKQIASLYKCYYVSGNHDFATNNIKNIKKEISDFGITVLEGHTKKINIKGNIINISGIDDQSIGNKAFYSQLDRAAKEKDNNFSVLLTHRPEYINDYLKYNYDLVLSGHAHGGQVRIPGLVNGLYAPGQGFLPKYAGGEYNFKNSTFIISRGLKRNYIPRIFNNPEVVSIKIKPVK